MDEFLDMLAAGIVKGADIFNEKAGEFAGMASEFVDKGRARLDRARLEQSREKEISQLGAMLYDMMTSDSLQLEALRQKCNLIELLDKQIEQSRRENPEPQDDA